MKTIRLTRGKEALVDDEDFNLIAQHRWHCTAGGYARRGSGQKALLLHRILLNAKAGQIVDHINGNRLDNRRCNLRIVSASENGINRCRKAGVSSQFKGVHWCKRQNRWIARLGRKAPKRHVGEFRSELEAAIAYDKAAAAFHGVFARLNFPKVAA